MAYYESVLLNLYIFNNMFWNKMLIAKKREGEGGQWQLLLLTHAQNILIEQSAITTYKRDFCQTFGLGS